MTWRAEKTIVALSSDAEFESGEEWKKTSDAESDGPPMPKIWMLCECCRREFSGPGQESLDLALRTAAASGWKIVSQRFAGLEDVDPSLGEDIVCSKCWGLEFALQTFAP